MFSAGQTPGVSTSTSVTTKSSGSGGMGVVFRAGPTAEANTYQSGVGFGGTAYLGAGGTDRMSGDDMGGFLGIGPSYHHSGFFADHAIHRLGLASTLLFKAGTIGLVWGNELAYQWGSLGDSSSDAMVPHTELVYSGVDEPPQYVTSYSLGSKKDEKKLWNVQYRVNFGYPIIGPKKSLPLAWTVEADFALGLGSRNDSFRVLGATGLSTRLYLTFF